MTFKDQTWNSRLKTMGDIAESAFEKLYKGRWARFGLLRPPLNVGQLPPAIRFAPDYVTQDNFIEVQGVGSDQTLKLKYNKLKALEFWQQLMPVHLWVWNTQTQEPVEFLLADVDDLLGSGAIEIRTFPEGTPYFALPVSEVAYGEA